MGMHVHLDERPFMRFYEAADLGLEPEIAVRRNDGPSGKFRAHVLWKPHEGLFGYGDSIEEAMSDLGGECDRVGPLK